MSAPEPDSKVLFRVEEADSSFGTESMWATSLGRDRYRLENAPFLAFGVSWQDVVHAPIDPELGVPVFERVIERGGRRTVRVIFEEPNSEGSTTAILLDRVQEIGGSIESANSQYFAIDVLDDQAFWTVCDLLAASGVEWEHVSPTFEELYGYDA